MYFIAWLLFILACILAVPIAALIDSQQRKKAQREALMGDEPQAEWQAEDEQAEVVAVAEDAEVVAQPADEVMPVADGDGLFGEDFPR